MLYIVFYSVHIIAKQANRYIVAFHFAILQYSMIFTYQVAVGKRRRWCAH